jgi:hypothetical protein
MVFYAFKIIPLEFVESFRSKIIDLQAWGSAVVEEITQAMVEEVKMIVLVTYWEF